MLGVGMVDLQRRLQDPVGVCLVRRGEPFRKSLEQVTAMQVKNLAASW